MLALTLCLLASPAHGDDGPIRQPTVRVPSERGASTHHPVGGGEDRRDVHVSLETGAIAGQAGLGVSLETSNAQDHVLRVRSEFGTYMRVMENGLGETKVPRSAIASLELGLGMRTARGRFGPAVTVDYLLTSWRENDCSDGYGCRYDSYGELGELIVVPQVGAGLRWTKRTGPGQGVDVAFGLDPFMRYDLGVPLPWFDLDIRGSRGWVFETEVSRFRTGVGLGHAF